MAPKLQPDLLTPGEVAAALRVDPKTVARWAKAGKLPCVFTVGRHRRYYRADIEALMRGESR
jgi:excisionase family DNA binding protein